MPTQRITDSIWYEKIAYVKDSFDLLKTNVRHVKKFNSDKIMEQNKK